MRLRFEWRSQRKMFHILHVCAFVSLLFTRCITSQKYNKGACQGHCWPCYKNFACSKYRWFWPSMYPLSSFKQNNNYCPCRLLTGKYRRGSIWGNNFPSGGLTSFMFQTHWKGNNLGGYTSRRGTFSRKGRSAMYKKRFCSSSNGLWLKHELTILYKKAACISSINHQMRDIVAQNARSHPGEEIQLNQMDNTMQKIYTSQMWTNLENQKKEFQCRDENFVCVLSCRVFVVQFFVFDVLSNLEPAWSVCFF